MLPPHPHAFPAVRIACSITAPGPVSAAFASLVFPHGARLFERGFRPPLADDEQRQNLCVSVTLELTGNTYSPLVSVNIICK